MYTQHPKLYNVHTEDHFDSIFILSLSHLSVLWSIDIQYKKGGLLVVALLFSNRFHRVTIIYSVEYDPPLLCVSQFSLLKRTRRLKMDQTKDYLLACYDSIAVQFFGLSPIVVGLFIVAATLNDFSQTGQRTFCVDRFLAVATGCLLMFPNIQWWIEL